MISMRRLVKSMIFTLFTALPAMAQTATDLQAKYAPPSAIYEISPSVSLTARFAEDNQACEMLITEKHTSTPVSNERPPAMEMTALITW